MLVVARPFNSSYLRNYILGAAGERHLARIRTSDCMKISVEI